MDRQLIGLVDSLERQHEQNSRQQNTPTETNTVSDDVGHLLKRRLLGAAVLVALAVIFLPLVLDGSGSESRFRRVEELRVEPPRIIGGNTNTTDSVTVASPPTSSPATQPTSQADAPIATGVATGAANLPTTKAMTPPPVTRVIPAAEPSVTAPQPAPAPVTKPVSPPVPPPVAPTPAITDQDIPLQAWIIQAGSFSDQVNALAVRDQLRQIGHPAFVTLIDTANGAFYRVNVGPLSDQNEAQKIQSRVQQELGSETLIKQYP